MRLLSRLALLSTIAVAAVTVPIGFAVGSASAATDPHAGFTQYTDSYKLQNRTNRPAAQVFSLTNGVININVHSGEQRVEMAWSRWPNLRDHLWSADVLIDRGSQRTAIMQVKNNALGEAIYIQVYDANGDLRNDGGGTIATNMYGKWFHIDADYNPTAGIGHIWINGTPVFTGKYKTGNGDGWYFKNGAYNNGLPKGAVTSVHFRNITTYIK